MKKKTTHAYFRQRGGVCRVRAEHSHLVYGESILERSIVLQGDLEEIAVNCTEYPKGTHEMEALISTIKGS